MIFLSNIFTLITSIEVSRKDFSMYKEASGPLRPALPFYLYGPGSSPNSIGPGPQSFLLKKVSNF